MNAHWTPLAARQDPLFVWWNQPGRERHAFREGHPFRALCDGLRWSVKLEQTGTGFCPECRQIVWALTEAARDFVVDSEATATHGPLQNAMTEAELVAGYGGLPRTES